MAVTPPFFTRSRWLRRASALFGALLVVAGMVDLHGVADAAAGLGGGDHLDHHGAAPWSPSGSAFFPEAAHPDEPLHAEPTRERELRSCVVCLERLGSSATPSARVVGLAIDPPQDAVLAASPRHAERGASRAASGRAPPRS